MREADASIIGTQLRHIGNTKIYGSTQKGINPVEGWRHEAGGWSSAAVSGVETAELFSLSRTVEVPAGSGLLA